MLNRRNLLKYSGLGLLGGICTKEILASEKNLQKQTQNNESLAVEDQICNEIVEKHKAILRIDQDKMKTFKGVHIKTEISPKTYDYSEFYCLIKYRIILCTNVIDYEDNDCDIKWNDMTKMFSHEYFIQPKYKSQININSLRNKIQDGLAKSYKEIFPDIRVIEPIRQQTQYTEDYLKSFDS